MKPLWKVTGFEQHSSWNARVPDCVGNEQKEWHRRVHAHRHVHKHIHLCVFVFVCRVPCHVVCRVSLLVIFCVSFVTGRQLSIVLVELCFVVCVFACCCCCGCGLLLVAGVSAYAVSIATSCQLADCLRDQVFFFLSLFLLALPLSHVPVCRLESAFRV